MQFSTFCFSQMKPIKCSEVLSLNCLFCNACGERTHTDTQILNSNFYWIKFATWMHCKQTPLANSHTMLKLPPSSIQAVLILLSTSSLFPSTWLANTCAQSTVINNSISRSLLECQPVSDWCKVALTLALVTSTEALFFFCWAVTQCEKREIISDYKEQMPVVFITLYHNQNVLISVLKIN